MAGTSRAEAAQRRGDALSLVLVEDHLALRKGLRLLLRREGWHVVGEAADADEGQRMIVARRPDVAIIDVGLPGASGVELARALRAEHADLGILLYTGMEDLRPAMKELDDDGLGFALKAGPPRELLHAVRVVAGGGRYLDPRLTGDLPAAAAPILTAREREVITLLADGMNGKGIAARLSISPETVRTHVRNAMDKLGARTRVQAIAIAMRRGEIEP